MCDKLNIFVIPHSFNDPGWINTSDENYVKVFILNIVYQNIKYVLKSIIYSLEENENRRFTFSGISFFYKWWYEQNDNIKERVKKLLLNEQVFFFTFLVGI